MTNGTMIDERGSLQLWHDEGDDRNPETYTVCLADDASTMASLEVAREWHELTTRAGRSLKLNGSQAVTVKAWHEAHL